MRMGVSVVLIWFWSPRPVSTREFPFFRWETEGGIEGGIEWPVSFLCWNPEKVGFNTNEEMPQDQDR